MADIKVRVGQQNSIKVISSVSGDVSGTLAELLDVNTNPPGGLKEGMILVYNSATGKWDASSELTPGLNQNLDINGGSF